MEKMNGIFYLQNLKVEHYWFEVCFYVAVLIWIV